MTDALPVGTEDEKEISEINKQEELQHTEDIDPRISELLKELDEYVLGSPAEKKDQDAEPSQVSLSKIGISKTGIHQKNDLQAHACSYF